MTSPARLDWFVLTALQSQVSGGSFMRSCFSQTLDRAVELVLGLFLFGACATQRGAFVPLGADHPAHPQAEPGWFVDVGATLSVPAGAAQASGVEPGAGDEPGPASVPARVYACPMHPDVRSSSPGTCAVCGMQLEEVRPKDCDGEDHHGR
jgi:Heavy metal binding domain